MVPKEVLVFVYEVPVVTEKVLAGSGSSAPPLPMILTVWLAFDQSGQHLVRTGNEFDTPVLDGPGGSSVFSYLYFSYTMCI